MTDEQLARSLHGAGLLTKDTLTGAARARRPGENLARTLVRLSLVQPGDILQFDPTAFDGATASAPQAPAPAPVEVVHEDVGSDEPDPSDFEGEFTVEGADGAPDPSQAPVVRWANELLRLAITMGASDIHLEPRADGLLPRYRIDGMLRPGQLLPPDMTLPIVSRLKVVGGLDITENRMPQDGRFRAKLGRRTYDFRVSSLPSIHGEKIVMRLLDHSSLVTDLAKLGFGEKDKKDFEAMLGRSHGMILVTGPTGSGKTTTLYAALAGTRDEAKNVITVEDPVEYELVGVTQTNVHHDIGLGFASVLRSILRQDPDVILVGEIRDAETADVAVRAALTGHLLLSTLHTNSAVAAVTRLQDMDVPPYLIASSLAGVIAQRLARLNCRYCRTPIPADDPARLENSAALELPADSPMFRGAGCPRCNGTGSKGRVALIEMLHIDTNLRRAIMDKQDSDTLRSIARQSGFKTLVDDAREKVIAGHLSPEEAMRVLVGHEE
jgi:type II secretory ATPase GspE/PulE/Tfp pilus assembly ATPase PilB-like protein